MNIKQHFAYAVPQVQVVLWLAAAGPIAVNRGGARGGAERERERERHWGRWRGRDQTKSAGTGRRREHTGEGCI